MKLTKKLEAEIKQLMNDYWDSYFKGDLQHWATYLVNDYRNIGGTEEEIWNSKKEILDYTHRIIDQMDGVTELRNKQTQIIPYDPYWMVHELLDIYIKIEDEWTFYQKFRLSSLIQKIGTEWKVLHQHGSYPDSKTLKGEAFAFDEIKAENIKLLEAVKNRTSELEEKNQELKIEAALERVRSRSMGMQKSEELKEVIKIVYQQLTHLKINLDHAGFVVDYIPRGDWNFWIADQLGIPSQASVPYFDSVWGISYNEAKEKGIDFFATYLNFEEKNKFYQDLLKYIPALPEAAKEFYFSCPSLAISTVLLDDVGLYIENFSGINYTNEENVILMRFGKVFQQTYTRFLDLQKAEAQAREAQIEAALERVRSQSMGMQTSKDLSNVTTAMFEQLRILGGELFATGIVFCDKHENCVEQWHSIPNAGMISPFIVPVNLDYIHQYRYDQWKKGAELFSIEIPGDFIQQHFNDIYNLPSAQVVLKEFEASNTPMPATPPWEIDYGASFKHGYILVSALQPFTEAAILPRFAKVFEQAYIRFLDLQKAEAQAREAQIEAALERVRSRSLAMHHSSELSSVVDTLLLEFTNLEFTLTFCIINLIDGDDLSNTVWAANPETGKDAESYYMKFEDYDFHRAMWNAWKAQDKRFVYTLEGEEKKNYDEYLYTKTEFSRFPKHVQEANRALEKYVGGFTFFKYSGLQTVSVNEITEAELEMLERFGKVFEQSYVRFLDLKKAEAQTREAQINLAVERVRARALAMFKSEEIMEVVAKLKDEVIGLNIPDVVAATIFLKEGEDQIRMWDLSSLEKLDDVYETPFDITFKLKSKDPHLYVKRVWENQANYFVEIQDNKGFKRIIEWLREHNKNEVANEVETFIESTQLKQLYHATKKLNNGKLCIDLLSTPPPEMESILTKMGAAFDLAYKRFEDLKNSEEQLREAQIEAALEKVRSRTMAMQRSDELLDVATVLFQQVKALGVPQWNCGFNIWDMGDKEFTYYPGSPDGIISASPCKISLSEHPVFMRFDESRKRGDELFFYEKEGEEQMDHYRYMLSLPGVGDLLKSMLGAGFQLPTFQIDHLANFAYGNLIFITYQHFPEMHDVFKRFARVFEQTYTRFLDLQKAEAQAREAKIETALEKVRSRTMAMQQSCELPEAANLLFLEVQALGIPSWSAGYNILAEDKKSATCWMSSEGILQKPFQLRLWGEDSFDQMGDFVRSNNTMLVQELGDKAIDEHYVHMKSFPDLKPTFDDIEEKGLSLPTYQINHLCKFTQGFVLFITYEKVPEAHDIFKRFTKVFEQTYTRFLDLQRAEAQTRQAHIETALERVRARALAMQEPEELKAVAEVLRHEMGLLGVEELETCSIYINDEQAEKAECWYALKDIHANEKKLVNDHFKLNLNDTWVGTEMLSFYNSSEQQISIVMQGANRKEWINYCEAKSAPFRGYYGQVIPDRTYHLYKFSHGAIGAASASDISDESWGLLKRAASVFSLAYSRFKDLTQARIDLQRLKEEKQKAEDALTNLQAAQAQLVQSEKMASLGELTAGIAHEIQNPLNFVNNFSEVSKELLDEMKLELNNGNAEDAKEIANDVIQNLEKINHHGKRAADIVKGMLQHSRSSSGTKEPTDINVLCDEYLRLSYHGLRAKDKSFNATLKTDFDESIGNINIIPQDIGRVVLNLLNNAFYAVGERLRSCQVEPVETDKNAGVTLSCHPVRRGGVEGSKGYEPTVSITTKKIDNKVEISVSDNGGGIPQKVLDKIFQPFFTTKPTGQGIGLGLSLSYDIVKAHGGEFKVETEEEKGSTFIIQLPNY